jgi:hypothetical protein
VHQELKKAGLWLETRPAKRKTHGGMPRFLQGWVERAQNSGRAGPASGAPMAASTAPATAPPAPRWPALEALRVALGEALGRAPSLPKPVLGEELEPLVAEQPDAALEACEASAARAVERGKVEPNGPGSIAWYANTIRELPPPRPVRRPGEHPKPEDPDFGDVMAWRTASGLVDYEAFNHRNGTPTRVPGGSSPEAPR